MSQRIDPAHHHVGPCARWKNVAFGHGPGFAATGTALAVRVVLARIAAVRRVRIGDIAWRVPQRRLGHACHRHQDFHVRLGETLTVEGAVIQNTGGWLDERVPPREPVGPLVNLSPDGIQVSAAFGQLGKPEITHT